MRNTSITFVVVLVCTLLCCSFTSDPSLSVPDSIVKQLDFFRAQHQEKLYLHTDKPYYAAGENIMFKAYLVNAVTHVPASLSNFIYVELINEKNEIANRIKVKYQKENFQGSMALPPDQSAGNYRLRAYTSWMRNIDSDFFYERVLQIGNSIQPADTTIVAPKDKQKANRKDKVNLNDFALTFFPEGGDLLEEVTQFVAFKAQGADGLSTELSGHVLNQQHDTVALIKTEHNGMGTFMLYPKPGDVFRAVVTTAAGITKEVNLPSVKKQGIALTVIQNKGAVRYQLKSTPSTVWPDSLYLVVHTRGNPLIVKPVSADHASGTVETSFFTEGITHFVLLDGDGMPLSERLVFIYPQKLPEWTLATDKKKYERREKISMQLSLAGNELMPENGTYSVSITDNRTVKPDSLADNILSNLLLTSDLKGNIENPGAYFYSPSKYVFRQLDLIMLTHGWRRFAIGNFKKPQEFIPSFFFEKGQYISGKIENYFAQGAKKAPIVVMAPRLELVDATETDEKGNFLIEGLQYEDSITFVIQARTKKGLALVNILMDQETVPEVKPKIPFSLLPPVLNDDYLFNTREKYYYEGGVKIYNLGEVVVKGATQQQTAREASSRVWADYTMTKETLEKSLVRSAMDLFKRALSSKPELLTDPLVVINGMAYWKDNYVLETIYPSEMLTFDVYRDASRCPYGSSAYDGGAAVVITLKPDAMNREKRGIALFNSLGYSKTVEFYNPTYETEKKKASTVPDLRTTVYWNPVLVPDSTGKIAFDFYTADNLGCYNVEVEGVTSTGKISFFRGTINNN